MPKKFFQTLSLGGFLAASILAASSLELRWAPQASANQIWTTNPPTSVEKASAQTVTQTLAQKLGLVKTSEGEPAKATAPVTAAAQVVNSNVDLTNAMETINNAFTNLADTRSPTVVSIYTKTGLRPARAQMGRGGQMMPDDDFEFFFRHPFDQENIPRETRALGSGFVINTEGYIVTNSHVVRMAGRNADEIMINFKGESIDKGHPAKVIGVDESTDVALLKLTKNMPDLKAAPLGDSDKLRVGEFVMAIGNPYGHTHTVTQGIVSAVGRSLEGMRSDFIQTSAGINPGNSGGPLFNMKGEVIGINTAIDPRAQSIGFAIPINTAKNVIAQLVEKGRVIRGWMGVGIQDVSDEIAGYMQLDPKGGGVLVRQVFPNQPAAQAGLKTYDIIKKVNGSEVKTSKDLMASIEKLAVGQTANVQVLRKDKLVDLKVKVGEQPVQDQETQG